MKYQGKTDTPYVSGIQTDFSKEWESIKHSCFSPFKSQM